jgi:hypothetical protein
MHDEPSTPQPRTAQATVHTIMPPDPETQPQRMLLSLLELPVALGVAFAVFVGVSKAGCAWAHCVDLSGLPWFLGGALLGLAAAIIFWVKVMRLHDRFRARLVVDAVAILVGIAGYVLPQLDGWRAEAEAQRRMHRPDPRAAEARPAPVTPQPKIAR